ncbi:MAG: hypothetical protein MK101_10310, partial [Phycisphaerales bacterium]|nr:hypothetical protein [Phycisphaerales bacterium]
MASEALRGLVRIGSNYTRLLATLVFGILLVPLLASWLGADALGLFLFLIAQAGLAAIFQDIMRTSLIRELAAAWHTPVGDTAAGIEASDPSSTRQTFADASAAASLVCVITALLAVGAFAVLWGVVGFLNIPGEQFIEAARWMLVLEC